MLNEDSVTGQVAMDDGRITGVKITAYQEKKEKEITITYNVLDFYQCECILK